MSLIAIEGLDGSGKGTQTHLLENALQQMGKNVRLVSFPNYNSPASMPVKMYLNGDLGTNPDDVNAYAASAFYAVDRYASYKMDWQKEYLSGKLILADRYTTSNMIYQLSKLPYEQWDEFLKWSEDFEYNRMELPKPDLVLFLDMPIEVSQKLISKRYHGEDSKKDIHERNIKFLSECRESALYAAKTLHWKQIVCADGLQPLSQEEIHRKILGALQEASFIL